MLMQMQPQNIHRTNGRKEPRQDDMEYGGAPICYVSTRRGSTCSNESSITMEIDSDDMGGTTHSSLRFDASLATMSEQDDEHSNNSRNVRRQQDAFSDRFRCTLLETTVVKGPMAKPERRTSKASRRRGAVSPLEVSEEPVLDATPHKPMRRSSHTLDAEKIKRQLPKGFFAVMKPPLKPIRQVSKPDSVPKSATSSPLRAA